MLCDDIGTAAENYKAALRIAAGGGLPHWLELAFSLLARQAVCTVATSSKSSKISPRWSRPSRHMPTMTAA